MYIFFVLGWIRLLSYVFFLLANMDAVEKFTFADLSLGTERVTHTYKSLMYISFYVLYSFDVVCRLSALPPPVESSSFGAITP